MALYWKLWNSSTIYLSDYQAQWDWDVYTDYVPTHYTDVKNLVIYTGSSGKVVLPEYPPAYCFGYGYMNISGLEKVDTSQCKSMNRLFARRSESAYRKTSFTTLDLSNWDFTNVEDMSSMFSYCYNVTNIIFPKDKDFRKLKNLQQCFYVTGMGHDGTQIMDTLDFSSFKRSKIENIAWAFSHAAVKHIIIPFDYSNLQYANCAFDIVVKEENMSKYGLRDIIVRPNTDFLNSPLHRDSEGEIPLKDVMFGNEDGFWDFHYDTSHIRNFVRDLRADFSVNRANTGNTGYLTGSYNVPDFYNVYLKEDSEWTDRTLYLKDSEGWNETEVMCIGG